ncbi:MAG: hypothetical protein M0R30_11650 [Methanoregula sp.]|jgi:hypothetical protein|uniref:hypothetical protein n=1 Tax=Methanoregula sp. TaxID=2052170 RepID=UPI0025CF48D8|nr:hypothetical protein [Methanoregula sp.]MCK9632278.1 hypothetical protein [Methanoregula sp.]
MAGLNDEAQWIVLMGFVVSFSLFFIAILLNQSTVVGQTTAEAVSEFPKDDIRGVRGVIIQSAYLVDEGSFRNQTWVQNDIRNLSLIRHDAVVDFSSLSPTGNDPYTYVEIHYNNGVVAYNETWRSE